MSFSGWGRGGNTHEKFELARHRRYYLLYSFNYFTLWTGEVIKFIKEVKNTCAQTISQISHILSCADNLINFTEVLLWAKVYFDITFFSRPLKRILIYINSQFFFLSLDKKKKINIRLQYSFSVPLKLRTIPMQ